MSLALVMLLNGLPMEQAELPPTDTEEPTVKEEVLDAWEETGKQDGWFIKKGASWMFRPDDEIQATSPPRRELAAAVKPAGVSESIGGLVILFLIFAGFILLLPSKKKKPGGLPENGLKDMEYQALIRQLAGMQRLMENVTTENSNNKFIQRKRGK